jgi:hypothetical protein
MPSAAQTSAHESSSFTALSLPLWQAPVNDHGFFEAAGQLTVPQAAADAALIAPRRHDKRKSVKVPCFDRMVAAQVVGCAQPMAAR